MLRAVFKKLGQESRAIVIAGLTICLPMGVTNAATDGTVKQSQKISALSGGLPAGVLEGGDRFGSGATLIGDLDGDGISEIAIGAHGDDDGGQNAGAVYVLFMNADGTVRAQQKISDGNGGLPAGTLNVGGTSFFGWSVAGLGDLDNDGVPDLAVGAYIDSSEGGGIGAVYILFLNAAGTVKQFQKISALSGGLAAGTLSTGDGFGSSVAGLGDLDNDGVPDLAVGAFGEDDGGGNSNFNAGAVYVLRMNANGTVKDQQKISNGNGGLPAGTLAELNLFGSGVTGIGDLDNDGVADLAVGAYADGDGGNTSGAVFVLAMNANGTVKQLQKISALSGGLAAGTLNAGDFFGWRVSGLGDLDDDGTPDLGVGAYGDDDGANSAGAVHILFLNPTGTVKAQQTISNGNGGLPVGAIGGGDFFGWSIANIGDLDGDGAPEIAVGASADDDGGTSSGTVHVLFLNPTTQTYTCEGFFEPFSELVVLKKKTKRAIPVKMKLFDSEGFMLTDENISAPPVINVIFNGTTYRDSIANDEELLPLGNANEDNIFRYDPDSMQWVYNLGTKLFEASGEYIVKTVSGNQNEYVINTDGDVCSGTFERLTH